MSRVLSHARCRDLLFGAAIACMLLALLRLPEESVAAARDGVTLCLNVILPSLFPFFVLSTLCVELGLIQRLGQVFGKLMYPLFRVGGACAGAFLLGILGGYPVGAKTAIELYETGQCSRQEAERMLSFCNNSGPAFILGVVGAGIFSSSAAGLWLYGAHVAASVLVGLIFRFYRASDAPVRRSAPPDTSGASFPAAFTASVQKAFSGILGICGFVIFFTVLIRLLFYTGVMTRAAALLAAVFGRFGLDRRWAEGLLTGAIEMTSGVWALRDMAGAMGDKLCMAAFILGWAGLCVHCQVLSFIGSSGLCVKTYFLGKLLHGLLSAALIFALSRLLGWNSPVSEYLATQVSTIAALDFRRALLVSTLTAGGAGLLAAGLSAGMFRKSYGNSRRDGV